MKISSARIKNYRSIKKGEIEFSPNVNVFIGKNNAGKTNFIRALSLFFESADTDVSGGSVEEDSVTQDDWFLLNTDKAIQLSLQLEPDLKDSKNLLGLFRQTYKNASRVSNREVKRTAKHFKVAADALDSSGIQLPKIDITKEFRLDSDSESKCQTTRILLEGDVVYDLVIGKLKTRAYSKKTSSGSRSYRIVENPLSDFKNSLLELVGKEYRFTSPTRERLTKQRRDRSGGDIANRLYNLHTARRASGHYKDLKSEIEGLDFTDGEFRPSLHEAHEQRFAELMIDVAPDLSLPIENFGEGLQSALGVLDNIIFFGGGIVAIEEPENSLHPSGQRSLFELLKALSKKYGKQIIVSSHSGVFIDRSKNAKLFRVSCLKRETVVDPVSGPSDIVKILEDLGFKQSHALLSNGVIWVEGPSDRPLIRRWLELRGVDVDDCGVTILPYGGGNLEHISLEDFLMLNMNFVVIMDSERKSNRGQPKGYKKKVDLKKRIEKTGNYAWITKKRAIDNYVPARVIKNMYGLKSFKMNPYETLVEQLGRASEKEGKECSYRKVRDSPNLARLMIEDDIERNDELKAEIGGIAAKVRKWMG